MSGFTTQTIVKAPVDRVWDKLSDFGNISEWNPAIRNSRLTSAIPQGMGASRRCDADKGTYLEESVIAWDPKQSLTIRITKTNLPLQAGDIQFMLRDVEAGTAVEITADYRVKFGLLGTVIDALFVRRAFRTAMDTLLAGLKNHVEEERT